MLNAKQVQLFIRYLRLRGVVVPVNFVRNYCGYNVEKIAYLSEEQARVAMRKAHERFIRRLK